MHADLDLAQLRALTAVVAEGSFEAAARRLHVTSSAISQRIRALETTVGRVLVTRSRPVAPTPSGETLLRSARQIEAIAADAAAALTDDGITTHAIALAVNADSLSTWLPRALAEVPGERVFDLHRADESRTAELLRSGTVMAAVTASADPVPGCTSVRLGSMRYRARASRPFCRRWFPDGATLEALGRAPVVAFDRDDALQDRYLRRRARRRLDPPRHHVPGSDAFVEAIRLGLGWGMVPDLQAPGAPPLVEFEPARGTIDVPLHWQQWRLPSDSLAEVAGAVRAAATRVLV